MMKRLIQWAGALPALLLSASSLFADEAASLPQATAAAVPKAVEKAPMTDIHDIASPFFVGLSEGTKKAMLFGGVAALLVLLILVGLWLWFRRKQGAKKVAEFFQPPEVLANMALDRLEPLMDRDGKAFYFELSEVTKHYLKGRFGLNAPEMTAEELLPQLPGLAVTADQKRQISTLFSHAEPVKYAGMSPEQGAMVGDITAVRAFVAETTPRAEDAQGGTSPVAT